MKVVILAGGFGTRLSEETQTKPKPMVEIGGLPILWHIMKYYGEFGHAEFVIALGYKGDVIKKFFLDYHELNSDITVDISSGKIQVEREHKENWFVHLVDTGINTQTGGRLKRLKRFLTDESFALTYGDGLSNVDLDRLIRYHRRQRRAGTLTAVRPAARFGGISFKGNTVSAFAEKPQIGEGWINGGFMVFEPEIFDFISGDDTSLEKHVLEELASKGKLAGYRHTGFWQGMDTLRDLRLLEALWESGQAPWRIWKG